MITYEEHVQVTEAQWNSLAATGTDGLALSAGDGAANDSVPARGVCNLNILAIDIGTTTGWALGLRDGALHSGIQSFAPKRLEGPGQRWLKFTAWLGERARLAGDIHAIYYELVLRHTAVQAAHVYGGFEAHLQAWADRNQIRLVGVPVPVIKKSATGKGNADKTAMVQAMASRGYRVVDDNHADALALLEYARKQEV